jgi:hypothetical protein
VGSVHDPVWAGDGNEGASTETTDGARSDDASPADRTPLQDDEIVVLTTDLDGRPIVVRAQPDEGISAEPTGVRRQFVLYVCMAVTDGVCFALALLVTARVQLGHVRPLLVTIAVSPVVFAGVFAWLGLYHSHVLPPAEEFRRVIVGVSLSYIENWPLAFDVCILAKTIPAAVGAKGAR